MLFIESVLAINVNYNVITRFIVFQIDVYSTRMAIGDRRTPKLQSCAWLIDT